MTISVDSMLLRAYLHKTQQGKLHLRVQQTQYGSDTMKARMRRVGSPANWDQSALEWDYPLTPAAIVALQDVAKDMRCTIEWSDDLTQMAEYYEKLTTYEDSVRLAIEKILRDDNIPLEPYPTNTINGTQPPFRHQSISYHWALRSSGVTLAHEPGLGKTRSACDVAGGWYRNGIIRTMAQIWQPASRANNKTKDTVTPALGAWGVTGGILIVCPKVMIRTWVEELRKWQNMVALEIVGTRKRKINNLGSVCHAHVVNYQNLDLVISMLNEYDAVIIDESHWCAHRSGQTLNVLQLALKARRRLLLTGTPVSNNLESVFYQMLICDGGRSLGSSKTKFMEDYFIGTTVGNGQTQYRPRDGAIDDVSGKMASCTYFLKKEEVLDLPEKTHTPLYLDMTEDQKRYYEELRRDAITYIQDKTVTVELAITRMMKLAQICQGFCIMDDRDDHGQKEVRHFTDAKNEALASMLSNDYAGHKVVVWARFTYEIERLCQRLAQLGVVHVRYDGSVPQAQRDAIKTAWNHDPNIRVFVGQLQMGIGVTLHAAECALPCCNSIYLGLDFSYTNWQQSMDRIHRIGQRWPCSYTYLLTSNGIDRKIFSAIQAKDNVAQAVHKMGKDFYLSLLTDDTPNLAMPD